MDPRLNAFRDDLADERLRGRVGASAFATGSAYRVRKARVALKPEPDAGAVTASELVFGELVEVFEERDGWAWVQADADDYVGYVPAAALGSPTPEPTHRVESLCTFLYPEPDIKRPPRMALALGAALALGDEVEVRGTRFRLVAGGGAVVASHVCAIDTYPETDYVAVAERFLHVPYLWGGRTAHGLDCSALVQVSLQAVGCPAPRDTDLQEKMLGHAVADGPDAPRHPGDLVFWPGHVGIMIDSEYMVHASGHHMMVVIEPLTVARERIAALGVQASGLRRLHRA